MLEDASVKTFRVKAFNPSVPCIMPRGQFAALPAIRKWFRTDSDERTVINSAYLERFGHAMVPLEFTRLPSSKEHLDNDFLRSKAPLSLFLEWTQKAGIDTLDRLYLAQASFSDLPQAMVEDLPTPDIVTKAGRGDIYDTNLWIGVPPTYTPLHRDPNPNLFVQLVGQKIVRILEPEKGQDVFAHVQRTLGRSGSAAFRDEDMMKGQERRVLEEFIWGDSQPLSGKASTGYEVHLGSGDGLFIPNGWWHSIKGVGQGITGSVSTLIIIINRGSGILTRLSGQLVVSMTSRDFQSDMHCSCKLRGITTYLVYMSTKMYL